MSSGQEAETAAATYLARHGYKIIERNYRTPACEIDIIAEYRKRLYFVEVKYRGRDFQGSGLDYVTSAKRRRMARAAEQWLSEHPWRGEICLSAIAVSGDFAVTDFIEDIGE